MAKGIVKRTKLAILLAVFTVIIMMTGSLVGAVQPSSTNNVSPNSPGNPKDLPGEGDHGGIYSIDVPPVNEFAKEMPGHGTALDNKEVTDNRIKLVRSESGLDTLNSVLYSSVKNLVAGQGKFANNAEPADYTSNLYDTVRNYLNGGDRENAISLPVRLAADGFTADREQVEERTANTKVFSNGDGTYTAVIGNEPIHYLDAGGVYRDIDTAILPSMDGEYDYMSVKNSIKTYLSSDSSSIKVDVNGAWFSWTPVEMAYVDPYMFSHDIGSAVQSTGNPSDSTMTYEDTFPYTSEEYIVKAGGLKHNLILSEFPESASKGMYLSYVGKIEMSEGMSLYVEGSEITSDIEVRSDISVRDAHGDEVLFMPTPVAYEQADMEEGVMGTYTITFDSGEIYLALNTPVEWLMEKGRNYPVVVDPNLYETMYRTNKGYVTRSYYPWSPGTYNYYMYTRESYLYTGYYSWWYDWYADYYRYWYRSFWKFDTSAIKDSYTVKQIDFHLKTWYSYSSVDVYVNVRELTKDPDDYGTYTYGSDAEAFFDAIIAGNLYNGSVILPASGGKVSVHALGGNAVTDMQNNLVNDEFMLGMHKAVESDISPGYGYFYDTAKTDTYLYVAYDPCPVAPVIDTGGPYSYPEGINSITLDASGTFTCGTSTLYRWDIGADGSWEYGSTSPTYTVASTDPWAANFVDDYSTKIKLEVRDLTNSLTSTDTTTFEIYNVNPEIITPSTTISGKEDSTLTFPRVEFIDPGKDTWTYYYDFDGDNVADKSGSTITVSGKHYVPSVSFYFCDNQPWVNLTVEDDDDGYSDSVEYDRVDVEYDGFISHYVRPADPTQDQYYLDMYYYYASSTVPVLRWGYMDSVDYEYRAIFKFDTSKIPSSFTPTKVTMTTRVEYLYEEGKMGVNELSIDPTASGTWASGATAQNSWNDAGSTNILKDASYLDVDDTGEYEFELDVNDFKNKIASHSSWYGVGFHSYDGSFEDPFEVYLYGGSFTYIEVTDGSDTYTINCYTGNYNDMSARYGYAYRYWVEARDGYYRELGSEWSILYVHENYIDYYNGNWDARPFLKFGGPHVDPSKVVGADLQIYQYFYPYYGDELIIEANDMDSDPESATDIDLFTDTGSSNIQEELVPLTYPDSIKIVKLDNQDYFDKIAEHSDWYGVGLKQNSGDGYYGYIYSSYYKTYYSDYSPVLLIEHRVPFKLAVDIENLPPVIDDTNMVVSPTTVKEGDTVKVSGITYKDPSPCDTHEYRVIVEMGTLMEPQVVVDWTPAYDGKLDFEFDAPDDDPDDADPDLSSDRVKVTVEIRDDDATPDYHYKAVYLELYCYEYYEYRSYYDWGVYQNLQPWEENSVTWNTYPYSYSKSTPVDTIPPHGDLYYEYPVEWHWDTYEITTLAQAWSDGTAKNYGVRVMPTIEVHDGHYIPSSDYYTKSYRPRLRIVPVEVLEDEKIIQPDGSDGKDVMIKKGNYANNNYGSWDVMVYQAYYTGYPYEYYTHSDGLIEFSNDLIPPETDEQGYGETSFDLVINNVDPVLDESAYRLYTERGSVETVHEGEDFYIGNIVFTDPAAGYYTEEFEYRIDFGSGFGPWTEAKSVMPGGDIVVPAEYEDEDAPSNAGFLNPYWDEHIRLQQYIPREILTDGLARSIKGISYRVDEWYQMYDNEVNFDDFKIYMSNTNKAPSSQTFADNHGADKTLVYDGTLEWSWTDDDSDFWQPIVLDTPFIYDGSGLIVDFEWDGGDATNYYAYFDWDYEHGMTYVYNYMGGETGYGPYEGGHVIKFDFDDSFDEPYGIIPPIHSMIPDDHPETGTPSDTVNIYIELRDDDTGYSKGALEITVENVAPKIKRGEVLIDGAAGKSDVLIVKDGTSSYGSQEKTYIEMFQSYGKTCDVITSYDAAFTASNLNNYDLVIFLCYGYLGYAYSWGYWSYLESYEVDVLTSHLDNGGNLWFVNNLMYFYVEWGSTIPTYLDTFFNRLGVKVGTQQYYDVYPYYEPKLIGTGGWFDTSDEFDLGYPSNSDWGYYYYATSMDPTSAATTELDYETIYMPGRDTLTHVEDSYGSKAMWTGFDLGQVQSEDDRKTIMDAILKYYGFSTYLVYKLYEGQEVTLKNWDIVDPAEGVSTETIEFEVDWGDEVWGTKTDLGDADGINQDFKPYLYNPPYAETQDCTYSADMPWLAAYYSDVRYFQLIPASTFDGSSEKLKSIAFRPEEYYYYLDTTWTATYYNVQVKLSHSTRTYVDYYAPSNHGTDLTTVFSGTVTWSHTGGSKDWLEIPFDTIFDYDGSSHIMMEITRSGVSYSYSGGSYYAVGYFDGDYTASVGGYSCFDPYSSTSDYLWYATSGNLVTRFGIDKAPPTTVLPKSSYMHRYRDDPCDGDDYTAVIHAYDDDGGHGTFVLYFQVLNVKPRLTSYLMMPIMATENGEPSVVLPSLSFEDPGTQIRATGACQETWKVWWDLDGNGLMNNAPDVIADVPSSLVTEMNDRSYGQTPKLLTTVNDDYLYRPIAAYILDDDMEFSPESEPDGTKGMLHVTNGAPVATLEAYIPTELRIRMTGTRENNLMVTVLQTSKVDPRDVLRDSIVIERQPGQPKENPYEDGTPFEPLLLKIRPDRKVEVFVTFDARPDPNDVFTQSDPNGATSVMVFLDFPYEDDYNPRDDDQSTQGHHWGAEYKFNVNQDGLLSTKSNDVSDQMVDKRGIIVGTSTDDGSDDAQFYWKVLSGGLVIPSQKTFYNDGSDPEVPGSFTDLYPSPWDGTAPVTYQDVYAFVYTGGFSLALYTMDDDGGRSATQILTLL